MAVEQADELGSDVAGGPDHGHPDGAGTARAAVHLGRRIEARAHARIRPLAGGRLVPWSGWIVVMDV
jgi:hypothetical protein